MTPTDTTKAPQDAPAPAGATNGEEDRPVPRSVTAPATEAEWRDVGQAAAIAGVPRGPWMMALAVREAHRIVTEAAARRMADAADDGA